MDGTALKLNFSEALQDTLAVDADSFTVEYSTDGGANFTEQAYTVNGTNADCSNGGSTITLTLSAAIADEAR